MDKRKTLGIVTTSGELKFRTSYDGATWGGYTTMKALEEYDLASNPYYVDFSTDGSHGLNFFCPLCPNLNTSSYYSTSITAFTTWRTLCYKY